MATQDAWKISGEDRAKHDAQFFQLKPVNGFVTGNQARDFFMQSGLTTQILGQIWTLADMNGDGKMDKKEFSVAMHLIKKKLQGYELPKTLPPSLKADPNPLVASFGQSSMGASAGMNFGMGGMPGLMSGGMSMQGGMPMIQPQASLGTATMTTGSVGMPRMANGTMQIPPASMGTMPMAGAVQVAAGAAPPGAIPSGVNWAIPHNNKLKYTQTFNIHDRNKRGYLLGVEARSLLMQSGLPQPILAQIWTLSDVDRDGKLTCDEFCIAMHLSDMARQGNVLPTALPAELVPSKARTGSVTSPPTVGSQPATPKKADSFGDLLGNMGMPLPQAMPPIPAAAQPVEEVTAEEQVTFEDKRKENFDKGQAELERRRAILREQQQAEANARMEKERQEAEKRERQRQEAENRRQAELQRQLERQREKEREIEEQRRKMVEQRDAARRELERGRQMEWEKQRKEQLLIEKQKEYEQLSVMKTQMASLKAELESLDGKKTELSLKISQVQAGVTDFTTSIDKMRVSRDRTLADIDVFERQSKELDKKLALLSSEKEALNLQVQTAQDSPLSDAHRTVMHSVELKKAGIQRLKKDVEQLESDTEAHLGEIDCENAELKNLQDQLAKLQVELPQLQKQQEDRKAQQKKVADDLQQKQRQEQERQEKLRQEVEQQQKLAESKAQPAANAEPNWFDFNSKDAAVSGGGASSGGGWDNVFSGADASKTSSSVWGANNTATASDSKKKTKFRTLYDFVATREDELSFTTGQEVWVLEDEVVSGMEDWHKGQLNGATGWFPKAYVEKIEEQSTNLFGSAFEPVVQSSTTQNQQTDLFSANFSQQPSAIESSTDTTSSEVPSEGLLAKAKYPWKARQESDLTFDKDDVILVTKQEEMRWFGQLKEKSGWFPKAYVKLIGVAPKTDSAADSSQVHNSTPVPSSEQTLGLPVTSQPPTESQESGEYYVAMYTYMSEEPADLTFNEGDMIYVASTSGDWWSGTVADQNKSGMFPANYVKKLDIQPASSTSAKSSNFNAFDSLMGDFGTTSQNNSTNDDPFAGFLDPMPTTMSNEGQDLFAMGQTTVSQFPSASFDQTSSMTGAETSGNMTSAPLSSNFKLESLNLTSSLMAPSAINRPASTGILLDDHKCEVQPSLKSASSDNHLDSGTDPFASLLDPLGKNNDFFSGMKSSTVEKTGVKAAASNESKTSDLDAMFGNTGSLSSDVTSPTDTLGGFGSLTSPTDTEGGFGSVTSPTDTFGGFETTASSFDNFGGFGLDAAPSESKAGDLDSVFGNISSPVTESAPATNAKESLSSLPDISAMENDALRNSPMPMISVDRSASDPFGFDGVSDLNASVVGTAPSGKSSIKKKKGAPAPPPPFSVMNPEDLAPYGGDENDPEQKSSKKPEIARVIAPYVATGSGQLSLEAGNLINVRQKSPRGWWEGELQVRGQKKKIGWFPANYVKLLGSSSARSTPEPTGLSTLTIGAQGGSRSATPQSIASQDSVGVVNYADTVVALYAYAAQNDDELTFQKDDVITVLSRDGPDWWSGQLGDQKGVFPSNYVTPNPQSQSWRNDTVQQDMTRIEQKRQHVIQELISTEESYNSDMQTALEIFKKPMMSGTVLPVDQVNQIFVNWEELIVCNKKLLQALRVRKKMSGQHGVIFIIGDILCESIPHMNPYMRFCSCQLSAAAALQRAAENSQAFQEFHRSCMQNPKVKGVHLSGYLLKPMQRITKYPLLIEKILGNTPEDHADRSNLEEALVLAQELCNQANQCVKEKQNCDCLEWIQKHVHCDGLAENIVFNSATNCLGPRKLIFSGILYKAKSNKELVGFLFNDFLLLAQTSRQLGQNFSTLHLFDSNIQFKMYRIPIFLNEVTVKKSSDEAEPCLFQITSDRILNLKAVTTLERDMWIRDIEAASKEYNQQAKRKLERAHSVLRTKPIGRVLVVVEEGVRLRSPGDIVLKRPNVGRILVVIQEAAHLKPSDSNGKSDPYCEVSMGAQEHRTKVIAGTLNPKWNASMQFLIRDVERDTLCFTVYDRDLYSPNDFLGRTEVRILDVMNEGKQRHGPITKRLILHEVETGEVVVKLDLQLFET